LTKQQARDLLFSGKRYNSQAEEVARKISQQTVERHAKWLVSQNYLLDQSDVDSVLSRQGEFCEPVIFEEKERITENQRVLLEIEKAKVVERQDQIEEKQKVLHKVVTHVAKETENLMLARMLKVEVNKLLWGFPDYSYFSSFAYSASLNFTKLGAMTTLSHSLRSNVLELVSNAKFCELMGKKAKHTTDPKVAIGFMGIENCRRLFPVLMTKPLLRWGDENTKVIAPKIWQHSIVTANVTRMRLEEAGYKEPDEGVLIGIVRTLSYYAVCNYFSQVFEDALLQVMAEYRENEQMNEYFACGEVKPTLSVLPRVFAKVDRALTKRIVEHIEWDPKVVHLKNALLEDIAETPILERSLHGVALGQAKAFSIYETMNKTNAFVDKHAPYWFAHVQLDGVALRRIQDKGPGRMTLSVQ
jgi:hypothetical protein